VWTVSQKGGVIDVEWQVADGLVVRDDRLGERTGPRDVFGGW
jgi:hypothetical protein